MRKQVTRLASIHYHYGKLLHVKNGGLFSAEQNHYKGYQNLASLRDIWHL